MAGETVRGVFDLDTGPAIRAVREYKAEAKSADEQTVRLGQSIDDAFGAKDIATIRELSETTRDFGKASAETRIAVTNEWKGMRRNVEREAAAISSAIAGVRQRMRALGNERATPTIDLDGVAAAMAQLDALDRRLDQVGRQRATPRVSLGGGLGGAGGRVGGSVSGGGGGRGGRVSGGGSVGGRLLDLGRRGIEPRNLLYGAGALYARPLLGAATSLVGSAGGAALGAGATGLAGLGVGAVGAAGVVSVAKPAAAALKDAMKAQQAYTQAVLDHGRKSLQAAQAQRALDQATAGRPGILRAGQQVRGFQRDWQQYTRPGQASIYGLVGDVAQIGRRAAPQLANDANISSGAVRKAGTAQARFLAGGAMQSDLAFFSRTFARELPTAERTLENVERTMSNIARASVPFFHDANVWVEHWTAGWRSSTSDIEGTRRRIEPLVQEFKDWRDLSGAVLTTTRDLFQASAPAGDSMVVDLTRTFDRWDAWIQTHPREIRQFFQDSRSDVEKLAGALAGVVRWLNQIATVVRPIANELSQVVTVTSSLGLAGTPGSVTALVGAYRGVRGGGRVGGGGGGAGGSGGGAGGGMAGMAGVAAVGALGARGRTPTRAGWARVLPVAGTAPVGAGMGGMFASRNPVGRAAVATEFEQGILQGGATRRYGLSRVGAGVARGAGGALRGYAPIGLGLAALSAASFQGNLGDRVQSGLSSLTLGLLPGPRTGSQEGDSASQYVNKFVGGLHGSGRSQQAAINAQIRALSSKKGLTGTQRALGGSDASFFGLFSTGQGNRLTDSQMRENKKRVDLLKDERDQLAQVNREMERQKQARLDDLSRGRATTFASQLPSAYKAFRHGGQSTTAAASSTVGLVSHRLATTRDAGVETLGEGALAWAGTLKNSKKATDELTAAIEARYRKMGRAIEIVNGNILTGSKSEWSGIRDAMTSATEQAREKTSSDFTSIQQQAVGSLRAMGFSSSDARHLVAGLESGGTSGARASSDIKSGPTGSGMRQSTSDSRRPSASSWKRATGGVIPGRGLLDTVPIAGGGMAAPGESWIANRHTMNDLSRATVAKYGLTAQQMIRGETRRHSQRFAFGGQAESSGHTAGALGLSNVHPGVANVAGATLQHFPGLVVTSTTGGRHAAGSLHYTGDAVDLGGAGALMNRAASWVGRTYGTGLTEGIHNPNLSVKNGQSVPSSFWGASTWAEHANHIHLGVRGAGGARGTAAGLTNGTGSGGRVSVRGVGAKQGGVPGALRQRAGDVFAQGMTQKLNAAIGGGAGADLSGFTGGGDARANMALGRRMMLAAGWGDDQWSALKSLWTRESGWSSTAVNKSSGAYGIPQALGHGHPFALGDAAGQIGWGLNYIRGRYGSPGAAWGHEQKQGWYARGGPVSFAGGFRNGGSFTTSGPTAFVAGEGPGRRKERVTVTPARTGASTGSSSGAGVHVTFGPGSVVVGGDVSPAQAQKIGEMVAVQIIEAIDRGVSGVVG